MVHVVRPQKAQQKERLVWSLWTKAQEYSCREKDIWEREERDFMPWMQNRKEKAMVELGVVVQHTEAKA